MVGVFDSGLGGLSVARALMEAAPNYSYAYYGDTANLPYGRRSAEEVLGLTAAGTDRLFALGCATVVVACNTASADALRALQARLPARWPGRSLLGTLVPCAEAAADGEGTIGVLATELTVASGAYPRELAKLTDRPVIQAAAPLLVPLLESGRTDAAEAALAEYLEPLSDCRTLIAGCTHYGLLRRAVAALLPDALPIYAEQALPPRFITWLRRHPEREAALDRAGVRSYYVSGPGYGPEFVQLP